MDPLSAVANVAAVIGLLDSVCRIGKETYKLISAVKHAPEEIQRLKLELEEIEFILVNMNRYCHQYQQQHSSLVEESFSAVARIYRTLRSLKIEYNSICKMIAGLGLSQRGKRERLRGIKGKFQLVWGGKLEASFVTLQNYKMQLSSSLQFLAGFNDLAVHNQIEGLTHAISSLGSGVKSSGKILSKKGPFGAIDEKKLSNTMMETSSPAPSYEAYKQDAPVCSTSNTWGGENWQSAVLPLMLLKPKIQETLHLLTSKDTCNARLSSNEASWIGKELESLLAKCHESAAVSLRQNPPTIKLRNGSESTRERTLTGKQSFKSPANLTNVDEVLLNSSLCQESPMGHVSVRVQCTQNTQSGATAVSDILLLLSPNPTIHREGVFISLSCLNNTLQQPSISRSMSTYAVVESDSPAFQCVESNDVHRLRLLLKSREVNPFVRNTESESLLSVAARMLRVDICELLLNEGADPNHCRSDGANAIYDVRNGFWYRPSTYNIPKAVLNQILRLFTRAGCDMNDVNLGGTPLHFNVNRSTVGAEIIEEAEIATLINLIICLGGDLERENSDGLTPLLYNAFIPGKYGYMVLKELLQWNANPHARTRLNEGALHLAIAFSVPGMLGDGLDNTLLQDRLLLLLEAGCDPGLADVHGHTPSDFALSSSRTWFHWCFAVERTRGLSMVQILDKECPLEFCYSNTSDFYGEPFSSEDQASEGTGSDWESCSDSADGSSNFTDSQSSEFCLHPDHVFLCWNGWFPWGVDPLCADCGLLCDLSDIPRRKWQAWNIFQAMQSQLAS